MTPVLYERTRENAMGKPAAASIYPWQRTFFRDMRIVKQAFEAAVYRSRYSRNSQQPGCYLDRQPALSTGFQQMLQNSVTEVDQRQIDIYRDLSLHNAFIRRVSSVILLARWRPIEFTRKIRLCRWLKQIVWHCSERIASETLDIASFLKLVIEALEAARAKYLIGGAIAAWISHGTFVSNLTSSRVKSLCLFPIMVLCGSWTQTLTPSIYYLLKIRAKKAGVKPFTPHDLRRTFVSRWLDAGVDIAIVAKMARHSNIQTTARYECRPDEAKQRTARYSKYLTQSIYLR